MWLIKLNKVIPTMQAWDSCFHQYHKALRQTVESESDRRVHLSLGWRLLLASFVVNNRESNQTCPKILRVIAEITDCVDHVSLPVCLENIFV